MLRSICFCLLTFISLNGVEEISLNELHLVEVSQNIRVRGFCYEAQDGRIILAKEPNLRSCCLNNAQQLVIDDYEGTTQPNHTAVLLEGLLRLEGDTFRLSNARHVEQDAPWKALLKQLWPFGRKPDKAGAKLICQPLLQDQTQPQTEIP